MPAPRASTFDDSVAAFTPLGRVGGLEFFVPRGPLGGHSTTKGPHGLVLLWPRPRLSTRAPWNECPDFLGIGVYRAEDVGIYLDSVTHGDGDIPIEDYIDWKGLLARRPDVTLRYDRLARLESRKVKQRMLGCRYKSGEFQVRKLCFQISSVEGMAARCAN
jgi:hypothetical protein